MNEHIRPDHENLLESLVSGKLPRNLSWNSVVDLIGQIGEVRPHGNDEFAFVVGSQKEFFKYPSNHSLEVEEISRLRRFLKRRGRSWETRQSAPDRANGRGHRPSRCL